MDKFMDYDFDIFLSYPRKGNPGRWVHHHFHPLLRDCLNDHLGHDVQIFLDTEQPTGIPWPDHLKEALQKSRLLVAVWTPLYFRSSWCVAEWKSMLAREDLLDGEGQKPLRGLVYPIKYSDGDHFDQRAKDTLYRRDLSEFAFPYSCFTDSTKYLDFHATMNTVAVELEHHLQDTPPWRPNWPLIEPVPLPAPTIPLTRL